MKLKSTDSTMHSTPSLEDPSLAFSELQEQVVSKLDAAGHAVDALVESLFADRTADTSLG